MKHIVTTIYTVSVGIMTFIVGGCTSKEYHIRNGNFNVRYNILYNANELLTAYERDKIINPGDDYESVIRTTVAHPRDPAALQKVIDKAALIISEKGRSNYVTTAQLLMAKAYLYNEEFFTAIAYSNDILGGKTNINELYNEALIIKARALFEIGDYEAGYPLAMQAANSAVQMPKLQGAAYTLAAQAHINCEEWQRGLIQTELALKYAKGSEEKTRLRFVCGQLYERLGRPAEALKMYKLAEKSTGSAELRLNAAIKRIEIENFYKNDVRYLSDEFRKLSKNEEFSERKNLILFALAGVEEHAKQFSSAKNNFLRAGDLSLENKMLGSKAYAAAAQLQLKQLEDYEQAAINYQKAIEQLPRSAKQFFATRNRLKYGLEISNLYADLVKKDSVHREVEQPPYREDVVKAYYEIATLYLQKLSDSTEAEKVYSEINHRFPENSMTKSVQYALNLIRKGHSSNTGLYTSNAFLDKRRKTLVQNAVEEASEMLYNGKLSQLSTFKQDEQSGYEAMKLPITSVSTIIENARSEVSLSPQKPPQVPLIATSPVNIKPQSLSSAPLTGITFNKQDQRSIYYFVISVEDAAINMSPSRFGIGEFNRKRYAQSNLKHKLLEFETSQVIYVGIFNGLNEAKMYSTEITPQLKNIMKTNGQKYSTAIISKENLEKIESDEIYKVYQNFSKQNE